MQDLSYLSLLDSASFEAERCRLIGAEIQKAPPERRKKLLLMQMKLDQLREEVTPEQFMLGCLSGAAVNLENISDQLVRLKSIFEPPTIRPAAER